MIQNLIFKYLNEQATEKEISKVFEWIEQSEENKKEFIHLKKLWLLSGTHSTTKRLYDWNLIQKKISKTKKKTSHKALKYAAVFIFLIASIAYLSNYSFKQEKKTSFDDFIVLEKSNGKIEYLSNAEDKVIKDTLGNVIAKKNNQEITYFKNSEKKEVAYNTIKVPYSKTFKVTLSDGTVVHLNAGTSFTYPENFNAAKTRKVSLKGEAFFKVFKNKTKPFIVEVNDVDIEVLGTTFNVSNYKEDNFINCVLTEGSVRLSEKINKENTIILEPNQKANWQKNSRLFSIQQVKPERYSAWINGELVFNKDSFVTISKKIERYYNIKITNNYPLLASQKFSGTINIKETNVENILELFKIDTPFKYIKKNNVIEIYNP